MIRSFKGKATELVFHGICPKGFPADLVKVARRKLRALDFAQSLRDLGIMPGNRLEALKGNLAGKYSIWINGQWRVVFRWGDSGPEDVEIDDYHR
jgi:toxin HigB-1